MEDGTLILPLDAHARFKLVRSTKRKKTQN